MGVQPLVRTKRRTALKGRQNCRLEANFDLTNRTQRNFFRPFRAGRCVPVFQGLKPLAESYYPFGIRTKFYLAAKSDSLQRNVAIVFLLARQHSRL